MLLDGFRVEGENGALYHTWISGIEDDQLAVASRESSNRIWIEAVNGGRSRLIEVEADPGSATVDVYKRQALLRDLEEQPAEANGGNYACLSLMESLCAIPSLNARFCGHPAEVAAQLDPILTELVCD